MSKATKRKHVTKEVLDEFVVPDATHQIAKVSTGCRSIRPMVDPPQVDPPRVGRSAPRSGSIRPKNYGSFRPIKYSHAQNV